jgi:hypothetical protein
LTTPQAITEQIQSFGSTEVKNTILLSHTNQNNKATINPAFAKTSRPCPPFCIQPTNPFAPAAVDTVSELDVLYK